MATLRVLALASLAPMVVGCGFTPMYATPGLSSGLATIQVVAPQGRIGYLLQQDLEDALAHDKTAPPTWRLNMTLVQTRTPRGLSLNDVAERYDVGVTVKYTLTNLTTGKVAYSGQVVSQVSYDEADSPYAGIAARQDAQNRDASDAARRIQIQLAAWLARHPAG
jgi:LPS-assembly lipoprotein